MKIRPAIELKTHDEPTVLMSFYRVHKRVYYEPRLLNKKTGELVEPIRRTKQSFVAECDINNIIKQYSATGQIKHISANAAKGQYLDLPDDVDFQSSMALVKQGEQAFASLPSKTRDRFANNPALFLEFMADPDNRQEAFKLGLLNSQGDPAAPKPPTGAPEVPKAPKVPEGS